MPECRKIVIVARGDGAPTRQQYLVLADEWITASTAPADPPAEFFVRYIEGHHNFALKPTVFQG